MNNILLITGASSSIGIETINQLDPNYKIIALYDKNKERTKNVNCDIIPTNNYILKIETNGSIDNDTILKMGINILNKKVCDLKNILEG